MSNEEPRKVMSLFLLFFPILILAAIPGQSWIYMSIKVMLVFYEFIVIKNFVDRYYT